MKVVSTPKSTLLVGLLLVSTTHCFSPHAATHRPANARTSSLASSSTPTQAVPLSSTLTDESVGDDQNNDAVVRSPLRFLGPYPTMPLRFPQLATSSQRERNITGVSLDWVLDTAANTNTINAQVALELGLEKVGEAPSGVGSGGDIMGGDTFMLGDCELDIKINNAMPNDEERTTDKKEEDDTFTFMQGLTASALPVASPAAAGLLGLSFFYCFEGGVEFQWGIDKSLEQIPSVTFYGSDKDVNVDELVRVAFESLPVSLLPSVTLMINGKEIPALFDTGSPITVLNARAAQEAGINPTISLNEANPKEDGGSWNPFSTIASNFQSAQEIAKATASGDILTIAGTGGTPVRLVKSENLETVNIKSSTGEKLLSESKIFIGDIPGLAALGGLGGGAAPPAAVLGMDVLSRLPRVLFRARQNEIYL